MHEYYLNFVPHSLNFIYHSTAQDMKLEMKIKKMSSYFEIYHVLTRECRIVHSTAVLSIISQQTMWINSFGNRQ